MAWQLWLPARETEQSLLLDTREQPERAPQSATEEYGGNNQEEQGLRAPDSANRASRWSDSARMDGNEVQHSQDLLQESAHEQDLREVAE